MTVAQVTDPSAVVAAVSEYRNIGPSAFFERYKRGPAKEYHLKYEGEYFSSKAILAGAYFHQHGELIRPFTGGTSVARQLRKLGFEIVLRRRDGDLSFDDVAEQAKVRAHEFQVGQ